MNAMYISDVHDFGYELFNVRNGGGLRPILRRNGYTPTGTVEAVREEFIDVLERAFGPEGAKKRSNVERIRDGIAEGWAPGGESWKELEKLFNVVQ